MLNFIKKSKRVQIILIAAMVLLTTSVSCAAAQQQTTEIQRLPMREDQSTSISSTYTDIKGSWAYEAISYVLDEGLFEGTSSTIFSPDQEISKADFTTSLSKLAGDEAITEEDNHASSSATTEVSDPLTRGEMAVLLSAYAESIGFDITGLASTASSSFSDSAEMDSATKAAVNAVTSLGLMSGKSDGSFQPDTTTTRAEAASVIYRLCQLIDEVNTSDEFVSKISSKVADIQQYTDYKTDDYETITLKNSSIAYSGSGAEVNGSTITITKAGTYLITGTLKDGQIIVDSEDDENVRLVLNNASITSSSSSPILVKSAKNTIISLPSGTSSTLTDGTENSDAKAALFSKDDLWINGKGTLTINGNYNDAISGNDDIKITEATLVINAADDGIVANDAILIDSADITVTSSGDGLKTTNGAEIKKGYIAVKDGTITVNSIADGIQAETLLYIEGGTFTIATAGSESNSSKALKAGSGIVVTGGSYDIDSNDDALHSNGMIRIDGGSFDINSGDDGIHADTSLTINDGTIEISNSYEGIESARIELNGGTIDIISSDDGINVAGGSDSSSMGGRPGQNSFTATTTKTLKINGGKITVNASGDGIDVNGSAYMTGGTVEVNGPTSDGNGALDYDGVFEISGGTLLTAGSSGMAQATTTGSTQYTIANTTGSQAAGTTVKLVSSSGSTIASFTPSKKFAHVVISTPDIKNGETYTLYAGNTEIETFTISSIVTGDTKAGGMQGTNQGGQGPEIQGGQGGGTAPSGQPGSEGTQPSGKPERGSN